MTKIKSCKRKLDRFKTLFDVKRLFVANAVDKPNRMDVVVGAFFARQISNVAFINSNLCAEEEGGGEAEERSILAEFRNDFLPFERRKFLARHIFELLGTGSSVITNADARRSVFTLLKAN